MIVVASLIHLLKIANLTVSHDKGGTAEQDGDTDGHRHTHTHTDMHSNDLNRLTLEPSVRTLANQREKLLRRARGVSMDAVDAARDALNTVVARRLTPEQREACIYEYRTQSVAVSGDRPLGGAGPWTLLKARSGKDIPRRYRLRDTHNSH